MPMEGLVKFRSPQNISGASNQDSVAAFSLTTGVDGDIKTTPQKSREKPKCGGAFAPTPDGVCTLTATG